MIKRSHATDRKPASVPMFSFPTKVKNVRMVKHGLWFPHLCEKQKQDMTQTMNNEQLTKQNTNTEQITNEETNNGQ